MTTTWKITHSSLQAVTDRIVNQGARRMLSPSQCLGKADVGTSNSKHHLVSGMTGRRSVASLITSDEARRRIVANIAKAAGVVAAKGMAMKAISRMLRAAKIAIGFFVIALVLGVFFHRHFSDLRKRSAERLRTRNQRKGATILFRGVRYRRYCHSVRRSCRLRVSGRCHCGRHGFHCALHSHIVAFHEENDGSNKGRCRPRKL